MRPRLLYKATASARTASPLRLATRPLPSRAAIANVRYSISEIRSFELPRKFSHAALKTAEVSDKDLYSEQNTSRIFGVASQRTSKPFLKARLQAALHPPSSSTIPTPPSPSNVLAAALPLLGADRAEILDPYLHDVALVLSRVDATISPDLQTPYAQRMVANVMAHCWLRSAELYRRQPADMRGDIRSVSGSMADYLLRVGTKEDGDQAIIAKVLDVFEGMLKKYKKARLGLRVPAPMVAAWAALLQRSGKQPGILLNLAERETVEAYLSLKVGVGADEKYRAGLDSLFHAGSAVELPATLAELDKRLGGMRAMRDRKGRLDLWARFRDELENAPTGEQEGGIVDPSVRSQVLTSFLRAVATSGARYRPTKEGEQLREAFTEILALIPRPLPREVHHLLLARRACLPEDEGVESPGLEIGEDVRSLDDRPEMVKFNDRTSSIENLRAAWKDAEESGRDLKMYMLYMEGLGRMGDLEGLQAAWNELVSDQRCREIYVAGEGKGAKSFPPTRALNHMISAALLVPKTGPAVALELFDQAVQPGSSVPCDLITINTVLRHRARMADLPAMSALFALAEKFNFKPDVITYTTLVQGLLRAGEMEMAKKALGAMAAQGIEPNERMCSMLIADLAKSGLRSGLTNAEDMLADMRRRKMKVGVVTWTGLISGYFRGGWEDDGWAAVRRMETQGLRLNRVAYNVILRQAGESPRAGSASGPKESLPVKLFKRMIDEGVQPSSDTFVILLTPMVRGKRWNETDWVIKKMEKVGFVPEKAALRTLLRKIRLRRSL